MISKEVIMQRKDGARRCKEPLLLEKEFSQNILTTCVSG
jgi:hypothetical protein